jgi:hypothetical protein
MNKNIIYIDVEDDITAIIGKVKGAKEKIVALVPPKRIGILQSAVNLRLLARAAEQSNRRLVLISSNSALMALAAAAKIPVAKNLQSKPHLAEIPVLELDNGDDVIDGAQLPIGEHAKIGDASALAAASLSDPAIDEAVREDAAEITPRAVPPSPGQPLRKPRAKSGVAVPNFSKFRKKLVLIIAAGILLIGFLVWAFFFAASASILITARTTDLSANPNITLGSELNTDMAEATVKTTSQEIKKELSVDFEATGSKEVGEKAKGQVVFNNCESETEQTIPAGTVLTANGLSYVTLSTVIAPAASGTFLSGCNPGVSEATSISASDIGEGHNTPEGTTFSVSGYSNDNSQVYFNATANTNITGGTQRQIKVVSDGDVKKASDKLAKQNSDDVKKQLIDKYGDSVIVLEQTFKVDNDAVVSLPAVGAEAADGTAKLTGTVTYSMAGVDKVELGRFLDGYFAEELKDENDQRIYDNGVDEVSFTDIESSQGNYAATLIVTAQVGPKIDDEAIKNDAKGKRYGEIQSSIEAIDGVNNVDIKFSPFWVSSAPGDTKRISVEFKLDESE